VNLRIRSLGQTIARVPMGWWVMLLILPALVPLASAGFFESHDGLFHVYRLAALDQAVRNGVLYPRWFPEFAFGYGHPVFNFYGPLSYYWGLPFTLLGADAALAMKLVLSSGLATSALGMYLFARHYLDRGPALVAAVVYAYIPYHLADLYVRGAVAEFLAFAWFPLVLWGVHRLIEDPGRNVSMMVTVALLLAALLLTHSLSVLIFAPILAGYVLFLLWKRRDFRPAGRAVLALLLAVALSAFYWLPVLTESQYVGLGHGASQGYRDHLLSLDGLVSLSPTFSYWLEPGVPISFPLGLVQVLILVVALALLLGKHRLRWPILFFLMVALVTIFMLTTLSLPIWQAFEGSLAFLQYPWRFQCLTALAAGFLAGAAVQRLARPGSLARAGLGAALLLSVGLWALWRLPVSQTSPDLSIEGMWRLDREVGQIGATWTGEYLPVWVEEQRWALSLSPQDPVSGDENFPPEQVRLTGVGYTRFDFEVDAPQGTTLLIHQFHYPGWQAEWQGEVIPSYPEGELGLAAFDLPPGRGPLRVRLGFTPSQLWGTVGSILVVVAVGVGLVARFQTLVLRSSLPALLAACCLLLAAILIGSLVLPNGYVRKASPINANLQDSVELLAFTADWTTYQPGDRVEVTLYWRALHNLNQDYKTFIHLTDADVTRQPTQHDDDPGGDYTPTTRWLPGELVPDTHTLTLPADLAAGRYHIWADMYEYPTVRNLTVVSADAPTDGNRVLLGEVWVVAP
jgi:hypothetical protein